MKKIKKLTLNKTIVSSLTNEQANQIRGGNYHDPYGNPWTQNCQATQVPGCGQGGGGSPTPPYLPQLTFNPNNCHDTGAPTAMNGTCAPGCGWYP